MVERLRRLDDLLDGWWDILAALALNIVFLALITLVLWPMSYPDLVVRLAIGYALLWLVVFAVSLLVNVIHRFFRLSIYDRSGAYIASGILGSAVLVTGWAAFCRSYYSQLRLRCTFS
jgi:hypothetical protein